jgi:hypothetical protein
VQVQLQASRSGDRVAVGPYLSKLCETLGGSMIADNRPISLKVIAGDDPISSSDAVSLAVDRQVEHCEVAPARVDLKAGPDIPDFLRFEGTLLTNDSAFVPGRLSLILFQDECLGHGLSLLSELSLPYSQLSVGLKHNARAALKLQTADNGRSKCQLVARKAPGAEL